MHGVDGDGVYPPSKFVRLAQVGSRAQDSYEHLLHDVVVIRIRTQESPHPPVDRRRKAIVDGSRRLS